MRFSGILIGSEDPQGDLPHELRILIPLDIHAACRIHVDGARASRMMDGDSAAARDETHDGLPRQRRAALGEAHEHVVDSLHDDATR